MILSRLNLTALVLLASVTSVLAAPVGVGSDATLAAQPKANSIAELAARYDSSSCVDCHQQAHDEWAESKHSQSIFGAGRTAATFKTTIVNGLMEWPASGVKSPKDVKVEHLMGCAKCHLPQLADATDNVAQEIVTSIYSWQSALAKEDDVTAEKEENKLLSLNINCLICHNRNAITHKWAEGYPKKDTVYGSKAVGAHDDPKFTKMNKSSIMPAAIQCGQCHGQGPNLEFDEPTQCATLYASYLMAYIPEGGNKTCQECHMKESKMGHNMQSYSSKTMSDKAVDMHVVTNSVYWRDNNTIRPKTSVRIELTNIAVGSVTVAVFPLPSQLGIMDHPGRCIHKVALHPLKLILVAWSATVFPATYIFRIGNAEYALMCFFLYLFLRFAAMAGNTVAMGFGNMFDAFMATDTRRLFCFATASG